MGFERRRAPTPQPSPAPEAGVGGPAWAAMDAMVAAGVADADDIARRHPPSRAHAAAVRPRLLPLSRWPPAPPRHRLSTAGVPHPDRARTSGCRLHRMDDPWDRVLDRARTRSGVLLSRDGADEGIPYHQISRRAKLEGWRHLTQGGWLHATHELDPVARIGMYIELIRGDVRAAAETGLFLFGLRPALKMPIDLVVPRGRSVARKGARVRASSCFHREDAVQVQGVPCCEPGRVLAQVAAQQTVAQLERLIATAHRLRVATPAEVRGVVDRGPFAGRAKLTEAIRRIGVELTHSQLEALTRSGLAAAGIPVGAAPLPLRHPRGHVILELDVPIPLWQVGVTVLGPHHHTPEMRRKDEDQRREAAAIRWEVVAVDEIRLRYEPQVMVQQVRDAIALQRSRGIGP